MSHINPDSKIHEWVQLYLKHIRDISVDNHVRDEEGYKFKAVQHFQAVFDLHSTDLAGNLDEALPNNNLVIGAMYFPKKMLVIYAEHFPDETRSILQNLFDHDQPAKQRITDTQIAFEQLEIKRSEGTPHGPRHTYISLRFLSLLLAYESPDLYNPLKPSEWKVYARFIDPDFSIPHHTAPGDQYELYGQFIEPLREYIKTRPEIIEIKQRLTDGLAFKDDEYRWMTQDIIFVTARSYAMAKSTEVASDVMPETTIESSETADAEPEVDDLGTGFMPLEQHLEEYVIRNWANIQFGEKLKMYYDEDGTTGQQFTTDVGIIDILAKDENDNYVVIELKRAESGYKVVGQILNYIGWVQEKLAAEGQTVRGMIIVGKADKTLLSAVKPVADRVMLKEYRVKMFLADKA
jgi:hypothetical protein